MNGRQQHPSPRRATAEWARNSRLATAEMVEHGPTLAQLQSSRVASFALPRARSLPTCHGGWPSSTTGLRTRTSLFGRGGGGGGSRGLQSPSPSPLMRWVNATESSERFRVGAPATTTRVLGLGSAEEMAGRMPGLREGGGVARLARVFDARTGRFAGWRPKVATWSAGVGEAGVWRQAWARG